MKRRQVPPLYPFLLAVYPILFLYARNAEQTSIQSCVKPALISLAATMAVLVLSRLVYRSYGKAGIAASLVVVMFFSYGQLVDLLQQAAGGRFRIGLVVFPIWVALLGVALIVLARTRRQYEGVAGFLRAVSFVLVALSLAQTVSSEVAKRSGPRDVWARYVSGATTGSERLRASRKPTPDIYYIIMDSYSRADVLKKTFGYDNSRFVDYLSSKGFYVAPESLCNYKSTPLSVASSLNMGYLQDLVRDSGLSSKRPDHLHMLVNPKVPLLLRDAGYRIVQVQSEYDAFNLLESDVALRKGAVVSTEFDRVLRDTTVLRVLTKLRPSLSAQSDRDTVLAELTYLERSAEIAPPKFVYAHITVTHSPFYVRADGSPPDRVVQWVRDCGWEAYRAAYVESVEYANKRLVSIIDGILTSSRVPPIIIQADHGGRWDGPILNAYYLPDGGKKDLYPSISPVNTFRVVFNRYLGGQFELLEDRTYQQHEVRKGALVYTFTPDRGETNLQ